MHRLILLACCTAAAPLACEGSIPPTDNQCAAAAGRLVELFTEANADDPVGRRAADRQHKNFVESCRRTGSASQALCVAQAETLNDVENCR